MICLAVEISVAIQIHMLLSRAFSSCEFVAMAVLRKCVGVSVERLDALSFIEAIQNSIGLWVCLQNTNSFVCILCLWNVSNFTISLFEISFLLLANVIDGVDADRNWLSNWCYDSYQAVEGELCLVRTQHGAKVVLARIKSLFGPDHHMSYCDLSQGLFSLCFVNVDCNDISFSDQF